MRVSDWEGTIGAITIANVRESTSRIQLRISSSQSQPPHPSHTAKHHGDLGQAGRKSQHKVLVRELQDMGKWKLYLEEENQILCPSAEEAERMTASSHCVWIPINSATEFCKEPYLVVAGRCRAKSWSFLLQLVFQWDYTVESRKQLLTFGHLIQT